MAWMAARCAGVLEPERTKDLDRTRPDLQPGADLCELAGTLVEHDVNAATAQRQRSGEPANAGPNDADARRTFGQSSGHKQPHD
jgi:hypothetical protein